MKSSIKKVPYYGFPPFINNQYKSKKTKYEINDNTIDVYDILSKKTESNKNIRDIDILEEELEIV